ncbi:MAG: recombinase family protein [Pseudomonadales bacterium]
MTYSVNQHGKHQFLHDHSRNVSRGHIRNARHGYSCGQAAPYGYDRMLLDENDEHRQRVRNGEQYAKPREWHVTMVPSDDPVKVATVRWLFKSYAEQDIGYRGMADDLNRRGVPSPSGGQWFDSTVRAILRNQAYIGTFVWNKRRMGKYHRIVNGEIIERDKSEVRLMPNGKPNANHNPPELWMVVEDSHEPLMDRATFDVVQAKIERRSRKNGGGYRTHTKKNGDAYLLSGLVFCQHCGRKMHGTTGSRQKNGKTYKYPRYICSTFTRSGANNDTGCKHYAIRQEVILEAVLGKLRETLLAGGNMDRLRAALRKELRERATTPKKSNLEALRRRHLDLIKRVDRGAERLLTAPESLLDVLTEKLSTMKRERDHAGVERRAVEKATEPIDVEAEVERASGKVWTLVEELKDAEPARMRELLGQLVERVELRFSPHQNGKRLQYRPVWGKIHFCQKSLGFASRGEPIITELKIRIVSADVRRVA